MLKFKKILGFEVSFKGYVEHVLLTQEEFIEKYLYNDKSLIVKQLNKIKEGMQKEYLINMFKKYIKTEYDKVKEEQLKNFMLFNESMIRMINYDFSEDYKNAYDYVLNFIKGNSFTDYIDFNLHLFTLLPDLYILARSHKYMMQTNEEKGEIKYPLLNIVYYGDYHVENLIAYLKENYSVQTFLTEDTYGGKRCLAIVDGPDTNLNKYIDDLKNFRKTNQYTSNPP
jgi:hypothetical protein